MLLQSKLALIKLKKNVLTAVTGSEWAGNVFKHFPVLTSQIRTLSSNWRKIRLRNLEQILQGVYNLKALAYWGFPQVGGHD